MHYHRHNVTVASSENCQHVVLCPTPLLQEPARGHNCVIFIKCLGIMLKPTGLCLLGAYHQVHSMQLPPEECLQGFRDRPARSYVFENSLY